VYLNQAEYISWRNPRIASFMQYQLYDAARPTKQNSYGGFATGLYDWRRRPKATFAAWRLPLYLPVSTARRSAALVVWGCARPSVFARRDVPADPETVAIQFRSPGARSWQTMRTVTVSDPHGYFDTRVRFPGSGVVRLSFTYPPDDPVLPAGQTVTSRSARITLR
jgi:hypothetical protein